MGSDHRYKGVPGSNASSDGKRKWADFIGVRDRGVIVEVKKWHESVNFYKDVKMAKNVAALAHDFARVYSDPGYAEEGLNIHKVVVCIQQELDPELASLMPLNVGKTLLDDYVSKHPLKYARKEWGSLEKEQKDELKNEIVRRAPAFFRVLEDTIACEHSRAGRQRKDLDEILPLVPEYDVQELNREIQDLRAIIREKDAAFEAKDAEIASLKEAKDAEITSLKEAYDAAQKARDAALKAMDAAQKRRDTVMDELYAVKQAARAASVTQFKPGVAEREEYPQTKEIQELKAIIRAKEAESEAKDAEIASLKEARNVALEAKEMAWCTVSGIELAGRTPCNGSFPSLPDLGAFLQDDDWMDTTELDNHRLAQ